MRKTTRIITVIVTILSFSYLLSGCRTPGEGGVYYPADKDIPTNSPLITDNLQNNSKWTAVNAVDTRAIYKVERDESDNSMVLYCDFDADPSAPYKSKGEVMLDLRYTDIDMAGGLVLNGLLDISEGKIRLEAEIPEELAGSRSAPNGMQIGLFSEGNRYGGASQYSKWKNARSGSNTVLEFIPTGSGTGAAYTEIGFDPKRIREVRLKFALNSRAGSNFKYKGKIKIRSVRIEADSAAVLDEAEILEDVPEPVITQHRRAVPVVTEKVPVREFITWSGISEYTNPWLYGKEVFSDDGFKGFGGENVEAQYERLESIRVEIGEKYPDLADVPFTDRRFIFCDFLHGVGKDDNGNMTVDHTLAIENLRALVETARDHNIKLIPVLFDFKLFAQDPGFALNGEKRDELLKLIRPELEFLGENNDVVVAIEPVNEPDVDYNGDEKYLVSGVDMDLKKRIHVPLYYRQEFVAECADAIREYAKTPVSFSTVSREFSKYWIHLLKPGDILNIHYYTKDSYTGDDVIAERGLEPETSGKGWLNVPDDVTVIYGEYQPSTADGHPLIKEILTAIRNGGYRGGLAWWVEKDFPLGDNVTQDFVDFVVEVKESS